MKTIVAVHGLTPEQKDSLLKVEAHGVVPYIRADLEASTTILHIPVDRKIQRLHELAERLVAAEVRKDAVCSDVDICSYSTENILRPLHTLEELQAWIGERWIYPAFSEEAFKHFEAKALEELEELQEAIIGGNPDDVLGELGDVMYCMIARALTLGIDLNKELVLYEGIGELFDKDTMTINLKDLAGEDAMGLSWATLSHKVIFNLSDNDITDGISRYDLETCLTTAHSLESVQASAARVYRNLTHTCDIPADDPWVQTKASRVERTAFDMIRYTSYVAEHFGRSFHDVMQKLQEKQLRRITTGTAITRLVINDGQTVNDGTWVQA